MKMKIINKIIAKMKLKKANNNNKKKNKMEIQKVQKYHNLKTK